MLQHVLHEPVCCSMCCMSQLFMPLQASIVTACLCVVMLMQLDRLGHARGGDLAGHVRDNLYDSKLLQQKLGHLQVRQNHLAVGTTSPSCLTGLWLPAPGSVSALGELCSHASMQSAGLEGSMQSRPDRPLSTAACVGSGSRVGCSGTAE